MCCRLMNKYSTWMSKLSANAHSMMLDTVFGAIKYTRYRRIFVMFVYLVLEIGTRAASVALSWSSWALYCVFYHNSLPPSPFVLSNSRLIFHFSSNKNSKNCTNIIAAQMQAPPLDVLSLHLIKNFSYSHNIPQHFWVCILTSLLSSLSWRISSPFITQTWV